jgi:ubiquitin C-terminal hydrolase
VQQVFDDLWTEDVQHNINCPNCHILASITTQTFFVEAPECLIITLNRFDYDIQGQRSLKVSDSLRIEPFLHLEAGLDSEVRAFSYQLVAIVCHTGPSIRATIQRIGSITISGFTAMMV